MYSTDLRRECPAYGAAESRGENLPEKGLYGISYGPRAIEVCLSELCTDGD